MAAVIFGGGGGSDLAIYAQIGLKEWGILKAIPERQIATTEEGDETKCCWDYCWERCWGAIDGATAWYSGAVRRQLGGHIIGFTVRGS